MRREQERERDRGRRGDGRQFIMFHLSAGNKLITNGEGEGFASIKQTFKILLYIYKKKVLKKREKKKSCYTR